MENKQRPKTAGTNAVFNPFATNSTTKKTGKD